MEFGMKVHDNDTYCGGDALCTLSLVAEAEWG